MKMRLSWICECLKLRMPAPVLTEHSEILQTLAARLNKCWAHYQYLSAEAEMRGLCPPSTAPCSPAPSRSLVIIRTDSQPHSASTFTSFDKFIPPPVNQPSPYRSHSSVLNQLPAADSPTQATSKKRWSIFKNINPFNGTPGNSRPGEVTPPGSPDDGSTSGADTAAGLNSIINLAQPKSRPATPPHQAFSFKFSLEWVDSRPSLANKNRKLVPPVLPSNAQRLVNQLQSFTNAVSQDSLVNKAEIKPVKPNREEFSTAKYSGRALAEWSTVIMECRSFYSRRKQEGVPRDSLVETPTMGVETFRMFGG